MIRRNSTCAGSDKEGEAEKDKDKATTATTSDDPTPPKIKLGSRKKPLVLELRELEEPVAKQIQ